MKGLRLLTVSIVLAWVLIAGCGRGGANDGLRSQPALQGFPSEDVALFIEQDQRAEVDWGSDAKHAETMQYGLLGWAACRDLYLAYDELVRTGVVPEHPHASTPTHPVRDAVEVTQRWLDDVYRSLASGDLDRVEEQLAGSSEGCAAVSIEPSSHPTTTIGDLVRS